MSRFARENPDDWQGAWARLVDHADNMRKRAREEGAPSPTATHTDPVTTTLEAHSNA